MESEFIYHVTTVKEWEEAQIKQSYLPTGLVKLKIEKAKVQRPVLFELAEDLNELFPHIYGPLNLDSVVAVIPI
jgi:uncharacterized protein (DUF952 family)